MIARVWRGWTRLEDRERYVEYVIETGLKQARALSGNRGAHVLHRDDGGRAEFVTISLWESWNAVRGFAGEDVGQAVFYPLDDQFLVARETRCVHFEIAGSA